jgi:DNA-binding MarR family transcriptional regulator
MILETLGYGSDMATRTAHGSITLLTRLSRRVHRRSGAMGVNIKQLAVLSTLREYEQLTQSRLAEILSVDANMAVHLLNDLEENGLVERRRDPEDRRRHIVVVTPEGARALTEAERRLDTLEDEILENLDAAERNQLNELLRRALDG